MKPNYLSSILFGLGISAAVLERAPGKCCFNINAVGSFGNHYWQSPIWQGVEGAFHLGGGGGGNDKKPSDFCYNHQDMSLTDSNGRKCHAQTKTGQLHCLQNPLGRLFHWSGDDVKLMIDDVGETDHTVELVDSFIACPSNTSDKFNIHALLSQHPVDPQCIPVILNSTLDCLPQEIVPSGAGDRFYRRDISQPERTKHATTVLTLPTLTRGDLVDLTLPTPPSDPALTITPLLRKSANGHGESHCPADLSGDYIVPKYIVKIDAAQPKRTWPASNHVKICKAVSAVYTFDVPVAWTGKKCELLFLLPSSTNANYTLKQGQLDVDTFKGVVGEVTNFASLPYKGKDLTAFDVEPEKHVVLKAEECKPGLVSFDLQPKKKLCLEFEQADESDHPIGLFYKACEGTLVAKADWMPSKIKSLTSKIHSAVTEVTDIVASEVDDADTLVSDIFDDKVVRTPAAKVDRVPTKVESVTTKAEGVASKTPRVASETGDTMIDIFDAKVVETPAAKLDWLPTKVSSVASEVVEDASGVFGSVTSEVVEGITKAFDDVTSKIDDWFDGDRSHKL